MTDDLVALSVPRGVFSVVEAPPVMVSQRNCMAALGVPPRPFLRELLPSFRSAGGIVAKLGKLRLARRDALVAHLEAQGRADVAQVSSSPGDADAVIRELGLRDARR